MGEPASPDRRTRHGSHDLAYVLGEGGSVGRSRFVQDSLAIAPLVLLNAVLSVVIYAALITRGGVPRWDAFLLVGPALATLPLLVAFVLVSLRDHDQPITVAVFVTGIVGAVEIAILSALRVFVSYSGALTCVVVTALVMIVVMLRLQQAESERVAILDFDGADAAAAQLGGSFRIIRDAEDDLRATDRVLIDVAAHHSARWARFLLRAYMRRVLVTPWVQFLEKRRGRVDIDSFDVSDIVVSSGQIVYSRLKRVVDLVLVLLTLPISVPLGLLVALYVRAVAGSPVLFTQTRRGYGGRDFTIYKFRTMRRNAGADAARVQGDDRVLPGMRLLRRLRLDELPQLINILKGDMSVVGPRPESADLAATYEQAIPRYVDRLLVRPGLTGWAQVNAAASVTVAEAREKLAFDLYYVKRMSLDLDLLILARTIRIIVFGMKRS